ncbi:MAG: nickel pincer cofactor biosynthesis protein LarC [Planctomycetota bacterium]
MRAAHFDPFSGASGDMVLAALADAGADVAGLAEVLGHALPFGVELGPERLVRRGIAGTRVQVRVREDHPPHRGLSDLLAVLDAADVPAPVAEASARTFRALAEAEAAVHGTTPDEVHFHEIGAGDTLVDVIGAHWLLNSLGVERATSGPVAVGSGTVTISHGEMPLPAPATAKLLEGLPVRPGANRGELTTPSGAAILRTSCARFGAVPAMTVERVGYGFGEREGTSAPNALRVFVGDALGEADGALEEVAVLETTVDDMPGEWVGRLFESLARAGALEVSTAPVGMKKSRPGVRVTVVAGPDDARDLAEALLRETTTFGVRIRTESRLALDRERVQVETPWGAVRVKVGRLGGEELQCAPEYEDVKRAAEAGGVTLARVHEAALAAYRARAE